MSAMLEHGAELGGRAHEEALRGAAVESGNAESGGPRESAAGQEEAAGEGAGRDGRGRFTFGNPGGPGNPFARQVGALRRAMLAAVGAEDVHGIIRAMIEKAKEGSVQAAKLVLAYALGKPQAVADPDRADVDEWELEKQTAAMMPELATVMKSPPAEVPLRNARALRPLVGSIVEGEIVDMFLNPEKHFPPAPEMRVGEAASGAPTGNGVFGSRQTSSPAAALCGANSPTGSAAGLRSSNGVFGEAGGGNSHMADMPWDREAVLRKMGIGPTGNGKNGGHGRRKRKKGKKGKRVGAA